METTPHRRRKYSSLGRTRLKVIDKARSHSNSPAALARSSAAQSTKNDDAVGRNHYIYPGTVAIEHRAPADIVPPYPAASLLKISCQRPEATLPACDDEKLAVFAPAAKRDYAVVVVCVDDLDVAAA